MKILFLLVVTVCLKVLFANNTPPKKWHPGFYVQFDMFDKEGLTEAKIVPRFLGVQILYKWNELEPTKDHFDFSMIDKDLEFLSNRGKQLVIQIQTKAFGANGSYLPSYLSEPEYGPTSYKVKFKESFHPALWNPVVVERLLLLYAELGKRYDQHPNVEIINLPETACDIEPEEQKRTGYSLEKYVSSLKNNMLGLKKAFPSTIVLQFLNYPPGAIQPLSEYMKEIGVGIAGPDVTPYNESMNDPKTGIYRIYPSFEGLAPIGIAVQYPDYTWKKSKNTPPETRGNDIWKTGDEVTSKELYLFAKDKLKVNYIFWNQRKPYFDHLIEYMKEPDFPKDEACGLPALVSKN